MQDKRARGYVTWLLLFAAVILTACLVVAYTRLAQELPSNDIRTAQESFGRHYAFVCGNSQEDLYRAIYDAAAEQSAAGGDYLEFVGDNLTAKYSRNELMEIAVDAGVDGIIVEADESEEMTGLINRADEKGIPVITVGRDNTASARKSFVGFGYYDLGQSFGKQILRNVSDDPKDVLILMSSDSEGSTQNIIFQGIRETLDRLDGARYFNLNTMTVPETILGFLFWTQEVISY